ncbi:MAG TPA: hypothetical protein V6C69_18220 [Trichormus sp.]|jgi:hypothetical protein
MVGSRTAPGRNILKLFDLISKKGIAPLVMALAVLPIFIPNLVLAASLNGFKLTQTSKSLGTQDVYVSPLGIKVINQRMGRGMVCCPPDWKVINWSTRTNTYAVEDYKKWKPYLTMGEQVFNGYDIRDVSFASPIAGTVAKYPATTYKSTDTFSKQMLYKRDHRLIPGGAPLVVTMDCADEPPLPSQIGEIMERQYQSPHLKGIPLRMVFLTLNRETSVELDTSSLTPVQLTKADYVFPKNLRQVQSDQQLNRAPSNEDLKDLMGL